MNNYSKQREIILEVIKKNLIHPTAEQIYELVIKKDSKISKSTVYRNINILAKQGIIQKITMTSAPDRYDYIHEEHQHVICLECGKIFDFNYNFEVSKIQEAIKNQNNIEIDLDNITVQGICENCKSKNEGGK